jgi:xylan 1,4-beta-xylosidase
MSTESDPGWADRARAQSYRNPVLPGFHPDPSVCRVGEEYFLVTSTFTYLPGVPIFRSRNLVDWAQIGNVLDRTSQVDLGRTSWWSSLGIHAPTIRHRDGRFWVITTNRTIDAARNFFVTAVDPQGPWSDPISIDIDGIDPDIAWDDEGNCWVHHAAQGILRCRIDDTTGAVLERPEPTWSGTGLQYPEAPHLFERHATWYLLVAEGGTERGHAVSIARGPSPAGPWESCPRNPIISHRSTDRPIQNTGHADLVEAADGSWWLALLGVRPKGATPGFHTLGRETFMAPVDWVDGWPVVGDLALRVGHRPPGPIEPVDWSGRDNFDAAPLHPRWIGVRRPPSQLSSLEARPGWLTIVGSDATLDDHYPAFVGRRQQHHLCRVRTLVHPGDAAEAGLAMRMDELHHYEVAVMGDRVVAQARIGPTRAVLGEAPRPSGDVVLVIETRDDMLGPDLVCLGVEDGDGTRFLAHLDGRYLSTEVAGGFIGRVLGVYAVDGDAAFDWFDYQAVADPVRG